MSVNFFEASIWIADAILPGAETAYNDVNMTQAG